MKKFKIYISNNFTSFFLHLEHEEDADVLHTTTYEQFLCKKMNLNKMIHLKYFSGFFLSVVAEESLLVSFKAKSKVYIFKITSTLILPGLHTLEEYISELIVCIISHKSVACELCIDVECQKKAISIFLNCMMKLSTITCCKKN